MRTEESSQGTITPAVLRNSKTGVMPSMASCLSGYWALQGQKSAHSALGTSRRAVISVACSSDRKEKEKVC